MATQSAEVATSISATKELRNIAEEIAKVQADIGKVGGEMDKVLERMEALQTVLKTGDLSMLFEQSLEAVATELTRLRKKGEHLRKKEDQLRDEKLLMLKRHDRLQTCMPSSGSWLWPEKACMIVGRYASSQTLAQAGSKEDIHI